MPGHTRSHRMRNMRNRNRRSRGRGMMRTMPHGGPHNGNGNGMNGRGVPYCPQGDYTYDEFGNTVCASTRGNLGTAPGNGNGNGFGTEGAAIGRRRYKYRRRVRPPRQGR